MQSLLTNVILSALLNRLSLILSHSQDNKSNMLSQTFCQVNINYRAGKQHTCLPVPTGVSSSSTRSDMLGSAISYSHKIIHDSSCHMIKTCFGQLIMGF